jgi:N-glycosylase/DNA lyase
LTVDELKRVHRDKQAEIKAKLGEFSRLRETASDERFFEELVFCIFTAGASAKMGLRSVERVRPVVMTGSKRRIQNALRRSHRFPNTRGEFVYQTREYLTRYCGLKLRDLLASFSDREQLRDFFAANPAVRGLGYKEASHFLRNVGVQGYAILDKHVLGRLAEMGAIDSPKPPSNKRRYLELEAKMISFAEKVDIDFDELDLLLWYTKTGEILK